MNELLNKIANGRLCSDTILRCACCHYHNKDFDNLSQSRALSVSRNEEENTKNNSENNSFRNKVHEILSKISFVHTVTFVWKGVLSSEIIQITDSLTKERLF